MVILKGKDIKKALSHPSFSFKTKTFVAVLKKNSLGYPRFAFIASRKFSKKAVERNRAKRLLREGIRYYYPVMKDIGYDIILIARKNILGKKLQDILQDIDLLIEELREKHETDFNKSY